MKQNRMKQNIQSVIDKIKLSSLDPETIHLAEYYITKYSNSPPKDREFIYFDEDAENLADMFSWQNTGLGFYFWYAVARSIY